MLALLLTYATRVLVHTHASIGCETRPETSFLRCHSLGALLDRRSSAACGLCGTMRSRRRSCKKAPAGEWTGKFYERSAPKFLTAKNKRGDRGYQSPSRRHLSNVFRYSETPAIYDLNVSRGLLEGSSLGNCLRLHAGRQYMQSGNVY